MSKILILGAGASYGHGLDRFEKPPMVNGFFTHSLFPTLKGDYIQLFNYLNETIGLNVKDTPNINIEDLFAKVEPLWRLHIFDHKSNEMAKPYNEYFRLVNPLDMLRSFVVDLVYLSTNWLSKTECPYHNLLASSWLSKGDTIISFNYDLMMDISLSKHTSWHESTGYGWNSKGKASISDVEHWWEDEEEYVTPDIKLLKLHGSLNFFRCRRKKSKKPLNVFPLSSTAKEEKNDYEYYDSVAVTRIKYIWEKIKPKYLTSFSRDYAEKYDEDQKEFLDILSDSRGGQDLYEAGFLPLLIMPTPYKPFHEMRYGELQQAWQQTFKALEIAKEVVACGFSFADQHFNQVLAEATRKRKMSLPITIVTRTMKTFHEIEKRLNNCNVKLTPFTGGLGNFVSKL